MSRRKLDITTKCFLVGTTIATKVIDLSSARMGMALTVLLLTLAPSFTLAIPIYKDAANPTGVPDVYQGKGDFCQAAAWADGVWWYNQYRAGLVNTQINNWYQTSQTLFENLKTRIYDQRLGNEGVLLYINSKREGDFSPANNPNGRGQRVIESTWSIQYYNWKQIGKKDPGTDIEAEARNSLNNQHQFDVLGALLHEQGDAATDFNVHLQDGSEGLWAHKLAYAGRDKMQDNSSSHLFLAHGWDPSHQAEANPVSTNYYDHYKITVAQPGVAGYQANNLQITDQSFYGKAGGLAPETNIDYAAVTTMSRLRDDHKTFYSFGYFAQGQQGSQAPASGDARIISNHVLENTGEGPLYEFAFEIPLLSPQSSSWISTLTALNLPTGWQWEAWDPNLTDYMTPLIFADEDGLLQRAYRGIRLFTETNPLDDGEFLYASFLIDPTMLDLSAKVADYSIGDASRSYFAESLGFAIPEPSTLLLLALGLVALRGFLGASAQKNVQSHLHLADGETKTGCN